MEQDFKIGGWDDGRRPAHSSQSLPPSQSLKPSTGEGAMTCEGGCLETVVKEGLTKG